MPPASQLNRDLPKLARQIASDKAHKVIPTPKRIRLLLNGQYVADSTEAKAVWEIEHYPQYYLPVTAFKRELISPGVEIHQDGVNEKAIARLWTIKVCDRSTDKAFELLQGDLKGHVKVMFDEMDAWFEEDTRIFVHPKDPFKRIDLIQSRRHIRISVLGKVVADTTFSVHLYETGLPARYYIPLSAVDQSVLRRTDTTTPCPYKGRAEYYSVVVDGQEATDVVWYYNTPTIESAAIAGLVCFYNEKVDIEIDGVKQQRPVTHFSD